MLDGKKNKKWTSLKITANMKESFDEIKEFLKREYYNKHFNNDDVMRFLIYFAKIAMELGDNPKLEWINEPIKFESIDELDEKLRDISNNLDFDIGHLRTGALLGLLEMANNAMEKDRKLGELYIDYSIEWASRFKIDVASYMESYFEDVIKKLLNGVYDSTRKIGRKKEVRKNLFKKVERLVQLIFTRTPRKIISEIIYKEVYSDNYDIAGGLIKRYLSGYDKGPFGFSNHNDEIYDNEFKSSLKRYLQSLDKNKRYEEIKSMVFTVNSLKNKLRLLEIVCEYTDVKPIYEELLEKFSLDRRIEIATSMIRVGKMCNDENLTQHAIEIAKNTLKVMRELSHNELDFLRDNFARELIRNDMHEMVKELAFPDEQPTLYYHLDMLYPKFKEDFDNGWREFIKFLWMFSKVADMDDCKFTSHMYGLFDRWWTNEMCFKKLNEISYEDYKEPPEDLQISTSVYGDSILITLSKGNLYLRRSWPLNEDLNFIVKFVERLIETDLYHLETPHEILQTAKFLLSNQSNKEVSRKILEKLLEESPETILNYLNLYAKAEFDILEDVLKPVVKRMIEEGKCKELWTHNNLWEVIVRALLQQKNEKEVLKIIKSGEIRKILLELIDDINNKRCKSTLFHLMDEGEDEKSLVDYLVKILIERDPHDAAEFVLREGIVSYYIYSIIYSLFESPTDKNLAIADEIIKKYGIGIFGHVDIKPLLYYKINKCIEEIKHRSSMTNEGDYKCFKQIINFLKDMKRKLGFRKEKIIIDIDMGRLITWSVIKQK